MDRRLKDDCDRSSNSVDVSKNHICIEFFFLFGLEMKVRIAFSHIWFGSANRVEFGMGRRSVSCIKTKNV